MENSLYLLVGVIFFAISFIVWMQDKEKYAEQIGMLNGCGFSFLLIFIVSFWGVE